jgi:RimJ/RimL family protein N-acetyltransferase
MNLVFRPACPEDKPRVLEITAHTWSDGDYIPEVWDNWLADLKGEFTVAVLDGVVVALAKLTWLGQDQWWIEGLRVAPEWRLKGIGQATNTYQIELARRLGGRVIRYATGIRNEGSHRIAERAGFHVLARFVERVAEKTDGPAERAEVLKSIDLDAVWNMARDSDLMSAAKGVYAFEWKVVELTRERLAHHLDNGEVVGVRDEADCISAWCLLPEARWERLFPNTFHGATEGITALAYALRAQAFTRGKEIVEAMVPPHPRVMDALAAAGYHIEIDPGHPEEIREHGIDILELRLDGPVTLQR